MKNNRRMFTDGNKSHSKSQAGTCNIFIKSQVNYCVWCTFILFFIMPSLYGQEGLADPETTKITEAYELRINGKAEKAEELLKDLLKNDSTDALAYFELARTKQHLFLGGTQFSMEKWVEVVSSSQQAVRYAPDNEIFAFYYAYASFFNAYISMMMQNPDVGKKVAHTCDAFQAVLNLNPDCHEALLYLVDIYAFLPEDMGGNKEKAGIIASDLNKKNKVFGAMAYARLMPDTADIVLLWENVRKEAGNNAQVLEELGRAYLLKSDGENGTRYFQEAINSDNAKRYLYMNLARYHILSTQENPDKSGEHLEEAEKLVNRYLQSGTEFVPPLKAHAYGILALIKMISGDNQGSNEYQEMAKSIDPYYSKGMGRPPELLYCPPDDVKIQYSSFFMPF
jgi:hypothetical protein